MRTVCMRAVLLAALGLWAGAAQAAEFASVEEMDKHVAAQAAQDLEILKNLKPREMYVAPEGKPENPGTKDAPIDLKTALTDAAKVTAGTLVWVKGGKYEVGKLQQNKAMKGTRERPIILRAVPGERATVLGEINIGGDHLWVWGLETSGPPASGVNVYAACDGIKVINCVLHGHGAAARPEKRLPSGHGIGGWDFGSDHEFYGNLIYWNGWNWLDHGFYSQNQPKHAPKRYVDNIVFENSGWGFHLYGSAPYHYGYYLEGNVAFATSLIPRGTEPGAPQGNILVGGHKATRCVILRKNIGYQPKAAESKRCVDIGYTDGPNYNILVEDNYFMGGINAFELRQTAQAVVRRNTFWAPNGMVVAAIIPPDQAEMALAKISADPKSMLDLQKIDFKKFGVTFEKNRYLDNGKFDLEKFRAATKTAQTDEVVPGKEGRPAGMALFKRVNRYEPDRVHLTVFNWPKDAVVELDLSDVLKPGDKFRIVDVHDLWGAPALEGAYDGRPVKFNMMGTWAPEFGSYVLFRPAGR
jgi:hypothetical protein